jgi:hypothetical protein
MTGCRKAPGCRKSAADEDTPPLHSTSIPHTGVRLKERAPFLRGTRQEAAHGEGALEGAARGPDRVLEGERHHGGFGRRPAALVSDW